MPTWLEQTCGFLVLAVVLMDVFLDVLYARLGTGILAPRISHTIWWVFLRVSPALGRHRRVAMSFCGPVIVGVLVATWALGLTLGTALIIHPVLGTVVRANSGATPTDFLTAMYVGGSSVSIVGGANFSPQTGAFKLFFLLNSLLGLSVVSLTLTYRDDGCRSRRRSTVRSNTAAASVWSACLRALRGRPVVLAFYPAVCSFLASESATLAPEDKFDRRRRRAGATCR